MNDVFDWVFAVADTSKGVVSALAIGREGCGVGNNPLLIVKTERPG